MARTWAQANTERLRLLALGRRLQVKVVKSPIMGNDGAGWPGNTATNDYMLLIKDPRPTGASIGLASAANQASTVDQAVAIAIGRWYGGANEHLIRMRGLCANEARGGVAPQTQWLLYGAGETREAGQIPNSAVQFA